MGLNHGILFNSWRNCYNMFKQAKKYKCRIRLLWESGFVNNYKDTASLTFFSILKDLHNKNKNLVLTKQSENKMRFFLVSNKT